MNDVKSVKSDFGMDSGVKSLGDVWFDFKENLKAGELGSLPAILSILTLVAIFGAVNPDSFLSRLNLANFLEQSSSVIVIAMAVTFVLLLGEIDLGAGFVAGVGAAVLATRLADGWSLPTAILISTLAALALGLFTGFMVAKVGIPSFVVTLANFLSFQGILLLLVRDGGSVRINNDPIKDLVGGTLSVSQSWLFAAIVVLGYAYVLLRQHRTSEIKLAVPVIALRLLMVAAFTLAATAVLSTDRSLPRATAEIKGVPLVVPVVLVILVLMTILLSRTKYGLYLYAVGDNAEAARRAGVNVVWIRLSAFMATALLAAVGGAFLASRVNSVDANTGANDTLLLAVGAAVIGGTSLFGGKGRMSNAVLGGLVLALIPNGLSLVGERTVFGTEIDFGSSGIKFIFAGLALLAAASVDALSRRQST